MLNFNYVIRPKDIKKYWSSLYDNIINYFFVNNNIELIYYDYEGGEEELIKYWI